MIEQIFDFFKKIKDLMIIFSFIGAMIFSMISNYFNLNNKIENLEQEISKIKIEFKILYRDSLIRNKIRIENEIQEITKKQDLTLDEKEKLSNLIFDREKILLEINQLLQNIKSNN